MGSKATPRASLFAWLRVHKSFLATYWQDGHLIASEYATCPFLGHAIEHIHFEASDSPRLVHGTIKSHAIASPGTTELRRLTTFISS
jgi:hypothetical protein